MVEAMIIAGGKGVRMNQDIPKQFLNINDIPVIVYTLKAFQQHPEIDAILVVCIEGWQYYKIKMGGSRGRDWARVHSQWHF